VEAIKAAAHAREIVRRTIAYLQGRVKFEQAILFGSFARGDADEWSDVDLAIVSPDFEHMGHRQLMNLLVEAALAVDSAVDVRPYTPRDFKEARPTNFLGQILAEGRVVYEGGRFLV
jgi:predicted nucleotidyltransferase